MNNVMNHNPIDKLETTMGILEISCENGKKEFNFKFVEK
jgi:hypothetical protein